MKKLWKGIRWVWRVHRLFVLDFAFFSHAFYTDSRQIGCALYEYDRKWDGDPGRAAYIRTAGDFAQISEELARDLGLFFSLFALIEQAIFGFCRMHWLYRWQIRRRRTITVHILG